MGTHIFCDERMVEMVNMVPTRVFLTKGVGRHKYKLKSFEEALRKAGVAQQNLVQVSSILPPKCKIISREKGLDQLTPGEICFCVMARADTNEHGRLVAFFGWHGRPPRTSGNGATSAKSTVMA